MARQVVWGMKIKVGEEYAVNYGNLKEQTAKVTRILKKDTASVQFTLDDSVSTYTLADKEFVKIVIGKDVQEIDVA